MILNGPLVDFSVILDWPEFPVFLLYEEEGGGVGAFRRFDVPFLQVFLNKLGEGQLFLLCQSIDFSWDSSRGVWLQLYGVIPQTRYGELLRFLFSELLSVSTVLGRE